jgi:hypothetical protein
MGVGGPAVRALSVPAGAIPRRPAASVSLRPALPVPVGPAVPVSPRPALSVPVGPAVPAGPAVPVLRPPPPGPPRPAGESPLMMMVWPRRRSRRVARRGLRGGDGRRHGDGGVPGRPGVMPRPRECGFRPRRRCRRRHLRRGRQGLPGRGVPHRRPSAAVRRQVDSGDRAADNDRRHDDQGGDSGAKADFLKPDVYGRANRGWPVAAGPMTRSNHIQDHTDVSFPGRVLSAIPATGVAPARLAWRRAGGGRWTA